jgi:hypothetical protein
MFLDVGGGLQESGERRRKLQSLANTSLSILKR